MKKKIIICSIIGTVWTVLTILISINSYNNGYNIAQKENTVIVHCDLENTELTYESVDVKYDFLPVELASYIENLAEELELDPDLCVAILMRENPEFNPKAQHVNENGTIDQGMFQLNDRYIWTVFVKNYWDFDDVEFNPYNWKHNTFLALHHLKYLSESFKVMDDIICSYNAGNNAVITGNIPESTFYYLAAVKNNYQLLKSGE